MKVTEQEWHEKMHNLIDRRASVGHTNDNYKTQSAVADYKSHMSKVFVGKTVLDVGCGSQYLKGCLPEGTIYHGLDAFPIDEDVFSGKIEDEKTLNFFTKVKEIETVCAFAVMDNVEDFDKAMENMKAIAQKNIVILTGLNIPKDQYHTFELNIADFARMSAGFTLTQYIDIAPKVKLIEFSKQPV
jgi:hypothetical protein